MPNNLVKSKSDEALWQAAKERSEAQGKGENYAYLVSIFMTMKGKKPRAITYEMDQKERAAVKKEAKELGYTHNKMGMPVKDK